MSSGNFNYFPILFSNCYAAVNVYDYALFAGLLELPPFSWASKFSCQSRNSSTSCLLHIFLCSFVTLCCTVQLVSLLIFTSQSFICLTLLAFPDKVRRGVPIVWDTPYTDPSYQFGISVSSPPYSFIILYTSSLSRGRLESFLFFINCRKSLPSKGLRQAARPAAPKPLPRKDLGRRRII